ncbi:MAG: hypothetical protein LBR84_08235 [Tannerella sp.]|jgi:hypothetical protein|nr:hypothetical protein [Tannerella sp.]
MKKSNYLYQSVFFIFLLLGLAMYGCKDEQGSAAEEGLSIKVFSPSKVMEGQKMDITGTGLGNATAVIFPGGISVTAIEATSDNMISVIVPAGIPAEGGELSVKAGDETAVAKVPLTVGKPQYTAMTPSQKVGTGDEFLVVGSDMEFFEKVIFPGESGDIVIDAIDFERKSTSLLRIMVPKGLRSGPGQIKLQTVSGSIIALPEMELTAGPSGEWQWVEYIAWEGEFDLNGWGNNFYVEVAWFRGLGPNGEGPQIGDIVKFYYTIYSYNEWPQFKFNYGDWSAINIEGLDGGSIAHKNNVFTTSDVTEYELPPLTEDDLLPWFTGIKGSNALVINGEKIIFTKLALKKYIWVEFD